MKGKFLLLILYFTLQLTFGQKNIWVNTRISSTAGIITSSNAYTPFLIRSLQYGTVPTHCQILYLSGNIKKKYDSLYTADKKLQKLDWGYEIEPHINVGMVNQLLLPQAYLKGRFKFLEFYIGRKKEIQGLVDTSGTMGSYIWSGNALPLPKLDISIPNFTSVMRNGLIAIKGNYAHGWFGDGDSVKNYYLHQKSFYGRLGKPGWKIKIIAGFNHQVQWGGRPAVPFFDKISNQTISKYGTDFFTYFNVVTGLSMGRLGTWESQVGVPANEAGNRSGNHLGTLDLGTEISTKLGKFLIYRQSIYEDGSLYYLNNVTDGLTGFSLKCTSNKIIQKVTFEYLDTRSQGGEYFRNEIAELRGRDNYFNNSIFKDGWNYYGKNIGSPILISEKDQIVSTSKKNLNYFVNSKVKAINLKIAYSIHNYQLATQFLHTQNFGSLEFPILKNQISIRQEIRTQVKDYFVSANIGLDAGAYWTRNAGLQLQAKKYWR